MITEIMTADNHSVESEQKGGYASNHSSIQGTDYRRRSSLNHGSSRIFNSVQLSSKLIVIVANLLLLSGFCYHGHVFEGWFSSRVSSSPVLHADNGKGRSMLSKAAASNSNCTKVYSAVEGETCATLRASQGLSQPQIFEINPGLNCESLAEGQAICVQGISAHCGRAIFVTKGPTNTTCATIEADGKLSAQGFRILNPGISCPEDAGNNNSWPRSHLVCTFPGLGNLFFEYLGASGLPITFSDVSPLVQRYTSVVYYFILAFAIDVDATGKHTNGTFYPYWSSELTPAAAKAFKAANPNVQILVSLGGASKYVNQNVTVDVAWEDPANTAEWIDIAQASLTSIVDEYSADGIDIDYESFTSGSSAFTFCVGTLIERLKGNNTIGLATVAPFGSVNKEYLDLIGQFGDQVDYVNFQFYAYRLPSVQSYVAQFNETAYLYPPWKLTASTEIGGNKSITGASFRQAVDDIQKTRGLAGVMFYDADDSVPRKFAEENSIAAILNAGLTSSPIPVTTAPVPSPVPSVKAPAPSPHAARPGFPPAPTPGPPRSSLAPAPASKSSLAPALTPGAPHSSLAPTPAPKSSSTPAPTPGAPKSSLGPAPAPESSSTPAPTPGTPKSSLGPAPAPQSSSVPAPTPGAPKSSLGPAPAPESSSAPASSPGAPKSAPASGPASPLSPGGVPPGSAGTPGSSPGGQTPSAPGSNSAPSGLLRSRWSSQGLGLVATVFVLLQLSL